MFRVGERKAEFEAHLAPNGGDSGENESFQATGSGAVAESAPVPDGSIRSFAEVRQLDSNTVDQIAAGEVVERPAAALKELIENSLDAAATQIEIELLASGKRRILVRDDGIGMSAKDLRLSVERHATSKIRLASDLDSVCTLGFRGEALASIGSVSRLRIRSGVSSTSVHELSVEGGDVGELRPASAARGTMVCVEELFFNTPARLKFLKSDTSELSACVDVVSRYACGYPEVAFRLRHGARDLLRTTGSGELSEAVASVWGRETAAALASVGGELGYEAAGIRVFGLISPPHFNKANRAFQFLYVNRRPMRSRLIGVALDRAMQGLTPERRYPLACLHLFVDPSLIDVNVTPTKNEVRFRHEGSVFEALKVAVRESLMAAGMIPDAASIALAGRSLGEAGSAASGGGASGGFSRVGSSGGSGAGQSASPFFPQLGQLSLEAQRPLERSLERPPLGSPEEAAERSEEASLPAGLIGEFDAGAGSAYLPGGLGRSDLEKGSPEPEPDPVQAASFDPASREASGQVSNPQANPFESSQFTQVFGSGLKILGQVHHTFILCDTPRGLAIIDQHVAHERILYERFRNAGRERPMPTQPLLSPQIVEFDARSAPLIEELLPELERMGFRMEPFGVRAFLLRSVPVAIGRKNPLKFLQSLADEASEGMGASSLAGKVEALRESVWIMASCKMAVKAGDPLSQAEMQKLVSDLAEVENPYLCPHGRPITVFLSVTDLHRIFKRS
ncbi:MAG: DNA mismatch repair endonuclease MutL [Fimbriimonadaceae bacterium]